jgi:predicted nucleic acid-binding protein
MTFYLLDTNVVSEVRKPRPNQGVTDFLRSASPASVFLSALTIGELDKGVEAKRRNDPEKARQLANWVEIIENHFADRIIPVDSMIARRWGILSAARSCPVIDTLIAATALERNLVLVTRNGSDVELTGVELLNPWVESP